MEGQDSCDCESCATRPTLAEGISAIEELTRLSKPVPFLQRLTVSADFAVEAMHLGFVLIIGAGVSEGNVCEIASIRRTREDVSPAYPEMAKRLRYLADLLEQEPRSGYAELVYDMTGPGAVKGAGKA